MAPESLEKVAAATTPAIDVWAIGCMYYTMVYGTLPFYSATEKDLIKMIRESKVKFLKDTPITQVGKDVILGMLNKDPEERLELIDFITSDYAIMSSEEFEELYEKTKAGFED